MDAPELFSANLRLIDKVARSVCLRRRLNSADVEDFLSTAKLALMEDDYAILRRFEGRSSLATFLAIVFDHMISDQRVHALGRWHPSRAAERMGPVALLLETLVRRDGKTLDEALPFVQQLDPARTREDLAAMEAQLPLRTSRPRPVPLDEDVELNVVASEESDAHTTAREARAVAARTGEIIRRRIGAFELEDRMLVRLHFGSKMSIADIGRMMRLPARPLYRRLETCLRRLRDALEGAGVDSRSAVDLIGAAAIDMNFGLEPAEEMENTPTRPSLSQEVASAGDQS